MSEHSPTSFKLFTHRLSQLLSSEEGTLILAQLQMLGLLSEQHFHLVDDGLSTSAMSSLAPFGVGVWEMEQQDGQRTFVRSKALFDEWRHWADVDRIPPKGTSRRVVLLGESAARGYFYDPFCTPARVLETLCNTLLGDRRVEVVDLARVDINIKELIPLIMSLPVLEPDVIVLFAGNNWDNIEFTPEDFQKLATAIRQGGYPACQHAFYHDIQIPACISTLDALASIAQQLSAPVIVLIPEFNLLKWRNEPSVLVPHLRDNKNIAWLALRQEAEIALAREDFEEAIRLAIEMIRLDEGISAVSQTLLGLAKLRLGLLHEARNIFEKARDAPCGLLISHSPRCPTIVQDTLRRKAAEYGFFLVNLPRIFEGYLSGGLPDQRLFLDYCHLTVEGIKVAMSATADQLVQLLGGKGMESSIPLNSIDVGLRPEDEARAHFLAAIHNAHYGQDYQTIYYHCLEAMRLSSTIRDDMLYYLDFQLRQAPHWLCDSYNRMCTSAAVRRYLSANDGRRTEKLADFLLLSVISAVLQTVGTDVREKVATLLKAEHGRANAVIDLLDYRYYATTFRERSGYSLGPERAYYQAYDHRSSFYFMREEAYPVLCRITCRIRRKGASDVPVAVNGTQVHVLTVTSTWQTFTFTLPEEVLNEHVNKIELLWPLPTFSSENTLEQEARKLERGSFPDVLPVFGEIHAFTAR